MDMVEAPAAMIWEQSAATHANNNRGTTVLVDRVEMSKIGQLFI